MMTYKVRSICLKFSSIAACLLFLQVAVAQNKFGSLETTIESQKKNLGTDFAVIVANKDSVLYQKSYGEINNKNATSVGAASAWFTTVLVLQLVDEGKISLDDKVSRYLPIYESYFKTYITIRHCLTHMTGIQMDAFKTASLTAKRKYTTLEEEVNDFAKKEILTNAGEEFRYNGVGISIAARVVEVVTKKKFEQLMRQRIFSPLGMRNTSFATDDGTAASPYSGAKSTPADLTRFLQMLLNNGLFNGKQILSSNSITEMRTIQVSKNKMKFLPKAAEGFQHALGPWATESAEGIGTTANVLIMPGLLGVWPVIDFSRGYVFLVFSKPNAVEQQASAYQIIKQEIDKRLPVLKK